MSAETEIAKRLRKALKAKKADGHSYRSMAEATGVPQPVITRFINGTQDNITLGTAQKLGKFVGITV